MFKEIDYLPKHKIDFLIAKTDNLKYKCIILLQFDAGLRVTEALSLTLGSFDFKNRLIGVESLKKRENAKYKTRSIPITQRLYAALANYIPSLGGVQNESFLFPSTTSGHLRRGAVNRYFDRFKKKYAGFENLHPHTLRHSFATHLLAEGENLHTIRRLLGHEKSDTTEIYAHIPTQRLQQTLNATFDTKLGIWQKLKNKIVGEESQTLINIQPLENELMIGRNSLVTDLNHKINRNINCILLGGQGVGKSTILKNINTGQRKVLLVDDTTEMKTTLLNTLLFLYEDKEKVFELMFGAFDKGSLKTKLSRHTMKNLAQCIIDVTEPQEYVLVLDTVDKIPPRVVDVLDAFKDHFTIVTSAREVPLNKTSFLWNFETIKVENLLRVDALELVSKLSYDMEIEDYEQYKNHIWNKSDGNPRVIAEMCHRYSKEVIISTDVVRKVEHYGSLKEIDASFAVLLVLGCMSIFRYYGRETGDNSLTFIGGCAMILLILSRYIFNVTKHKVLK